MTLLARPLSALAALTLIGAAAAHSSLKSSTPENGSTLAEAPSEVTLEMKEAVEVRFSIFKVYPLETSPELSRRELTAAAEALIEEVLELRDDDEARVDTGVVTEERTTPTITLSLREDLEPGSYLVMWRALSIDSHTTEGFIIFTFDPEQLPAGESDVDHNLAAAGD